jgi:predicted nucleotidyltransferase
MNPNLDILIEAVEQLGELADEMVFVGGCATGLLITDKAAPPIRITKDVDAIVQVMSRGDYYQFSDRLRAQGFSEDTSEDAPICRWKSADGILLDVMPIDPEVLGFGNKWYEPATRHAEEFMLPSEQMIKLISAPYFLITKLDAFEGRGKNDYLMSHDIEDIIAVFDGRAELVDDVKNVEAELVTELSRRFSDLLKDSRFLEAVPGHMPVDSISQQRVSEVFKAMELIAKL